MRVYLVQHGEAMSKEEDPHRPLTDLGSEHTRWVADVAAKLGVEVQQIRHSGKTRARQTAEILSQALSPREGMVPASGLGPLDDVERVAEELDGASHPVMLVGHLPFLERLAGLMLTGDADQPVVRFNNAGIVCLEKQDERWQVPWIITPEIAEIAGGA